MARAWPLMNLNAAPRASAAVGSHSARHWHWQGETASRWPNGRGSVRTRKNRSPSLSQASRGATASLSASQMRGRGPGSEQSQAPAVRPSGGGRGISNKFQRSWKRVMYTGKLITPATYQ